MNQVREVVWDLFLIFLTLVWFQPLITYKRWRGGCYDWTWDRR